MSDGAELTGGEDTLADWGGAGQGDRLQEVGWLAPLFIGVGGVIRGRAGQGLGVLGGWRAGPST